jgi:hypothetical protein
VVLRPVLPAGLAGQAGDHAPPRAAAGWAIFGEAGLIDNKPRNATVTTTQFLVLGLSPFHDRMERQPDVREKIQAVLDQRRAPT